MTDPRGWEALTQAEGDADVRAETLARAFHEAYERLAPEYRYKTRAESAVPWEDVPQANRSLMVAVVREVRAAELDALAVAERERDEAREALRPFVTRGVNPDAPPRPMTFEEGQFVVWMRRDEVESARAALAGGPQR